MSKKFLFGAATAAHQVEGNNVHSDCWALEQMPDSTYKEPSLSAVDHYNKYQEDIQLLEKAGLNSYRFSIEWARIEPVKGSFDEKEIEHYREVLTYCIDHGITPVVTMHHFSSPKWLIAQGGWEDQRTIQAFADYCGYVVERLGHLMTYVCTINEANMGLQIASIAKDMMRQLEGSLQIGLNFEMPEEYKEKARKEATIFGLPPEKPVNTFLSVRTEDGDRLILKAHEAARDRMRSSCPHLKVGVTLSLYDIQTLAGGEEAAQEEWVEQFAHYLPYLQKDDFFGLQNYTRKIFGPERSLLADPDSEVTQMGYEFYPEALENVIRRVWDELKLPILITENGVATTDDTRRVEFISRATQGIKNCLDDGIPVEGYYYWSLLDNFEWQEGFSKNFGLIAVDRQTQQRLPKKSLTALGEFGRQRFF